MRATDKMIPIDKFLKVVKSENENPLYENNLDMFIKVWQRIAGEHWWESEIFNSVVKEKEKEQVSDKS